LPLIISLSWFLELLKIPVLAENVELGLADPDESLLVGRTAVIVSNLQKHKTPNNPPRPPKQTTTTTSFLTHNKITEQISKLKIQNNTLLTKSKMHSSTTTTTTTTLVLKQKTHQVLKLARTNKQRHKVISSHCLKTFPPSQKKRKIKPSFQAHNKITEQIFKFKIQNTLF